MVPALQPSALAVWRYDWPSASKRPTLAASTLLPVGRPRRLPFSLALATPALTRSAMIERSSSATAATMVRNVAATGLNWYGGYVGTRQTEPQWSRRLVELLCADGLNARRECRYPALPRARCDVVVELGRVHGQQLAAGRCSFVSVTETRISAFRGKLRFFHR